MYFGTIYPKFNLIYLANYQRLGLILLNLQARKQFKTQIGAKQICDSNKPSVDSISHNNNNKSNLFKIHRPSELMSICWFPFYCRSLQTNRHYLPKGVIHQLRHRHSFFRQIQQNLRHLWTLPPYQCHTKVYSKKKSISSCSK